MNPVFVPIYARLVQWGRWTMEQVPQAYRAAVTTWVQEHPQG